MNTLLAAAGVAVLVAMGLALARTLLGPTVWDRILAVNSFGTKTVLLIALLGAFAGRADYFDVALLYALINFVSTVALMRYCEGAGAQAQDEGAPDHDEAGSGVPSRASRNEAGR